MVIRVKQSKTGRVRLSRRSKLWIGHFGTLQHTSEEEVELINTSDLSWHIQHDLFIESQWWKAIRRKVLKRDGASCVLCGSVVQLQVDHITYPGFGKEALKDLQTLCYVCHADKTKSKDMLARKPLTRVVVSTKNKTQLFTLLRKSK